MNVLLTNDDGIRARGLRAIYVALRKRGHTVLAVAPAKQQSGVSRSLTVFEPLRAEECIEPDFNGFGVHGTPADCVKLALAEFAADPPDIVISGINLGRNVGPDIFYSGTVGAAAEGAHAGLASMAISRAGMTGGNDLMEVARHAVYLAEKLATDACIAGHVINVNYPETPLKNAQGPRLCRQSPAVWQNTYVRKTDPRGWPYWWLAGELNKDSCNNNNDIDLLEHGFITITPLKFDFTDHSLMSKLQYLEL